MPRALVIGLDSLSARLALGPWRGRLPTLSRLAEEGWAGTLRSVDPPITVPAWASMLTGCDPGELGLYGFQDRADRSYDRRVLASSTRVRKPPVWERAARAGLRSIVIGVPPSYPPRRLEGVLQVCDFLAPGTDGEYTSPPGLAREIEQRVGSYRLDVEDYRAHDKGRILRECAAMTAQRFALAQHWMETREWDLFVLVEIGTDRLQHALFSRVDPAHPRAVGDDALAEGTWAYLASLDAQLGALLERAPRDAAVLVVSDHGARPLHGGVRVNEWLRREGHLVLRDAPADGAPFDPRAVDWERTRAWADGGYVGRVHLNVAGREPRGCVRPEDTERLRDEIAAGLAAIEGPDDRRIGADAVRPEERYRTCRGVPPDLWVYFGALDWRAVGSFGAGPLWTRENDTGPDEANHDFDGLAVLRAPGWRMPASGTADLLDVAPTLLDLLGLPGGEGLAGRSLVAGATAVP